jgi:hypothetical protein
MITLGDPATPVTSTPAQRTAAILVMFGFGVAFGIIGTGIYYDREITPMKYGDRCYNQHGKLIR